MEATKKRYFADHDRVVQEFQRVEYWIDQILTQNYSIMGSQISVSDRTLMSCLLPFEVVQAIFRLKSYLGQQNLIYLGS